MFRKIRAFDDKIVDCITRLHNPVLDRIMIMATYAGTGAMLWWIALAAPFLISTKYRKTGVILAAALAVNYLIGEIIIKKTVGRARPSSLLSDEEMKISRPKDHSFPSGHTASSFCAFMVTLLCCAPWIWICALVAASMIAFSRVYLRVHYVSDVLGGLILGVIDGAAATLILQKVLENVRFY